MNYMPVIHNGKSGFYYVKITYIYMHFLTGTNITVYHSFHEEVRLYQQHWWRCNGSCQTRKPYFGMVRRATNRAPGPNDRWWVEHTRTCGGTFIKVKMYTNSENFFINVCRTGEGTREID